MAASLIDPFAFSFPGELLACSIAFVQPNQKAEHKREVKYKAVEVEIPLRTVKRVGASHFYTSASILLVCAVVAGDSRDRVEQDRKAHRAKENVDGPGDARVGVKVSK